MARDLTDQRLKNIAKTDSTKHFDARTTGLFAQRLKAGANISLKYRFQLNRKTRELHLGTYPRLSLAQAREKSRNYADIVSSGKNPALEKKREKLLLPQIETLSDITKVWFENDFGGKDPKYRKRSWSRLSEVLTRIGDFPLKDLEPMDIDRILQPIKQRAPGQAERAHAAFSMIYDYAIARGLVRYNIVAPLKRSYKAPPATNRRALLREDDQRTMLADVLAYDARPISDLLFFALLLTGARVNEITGGQWCEIDFDKRIWTIPRERVKSNRIRESEPHDIMLSDQLLIILETTRELTGNHPYLVPSTKRYSRLPTMTNETVQKRLRESGYRGRQDQHGFRSMMSTYLNQVRKGYENAVEIMSHRTIKGVKRDYNRYDYWDERVELYQVWGDRVQALSPIPISEVGKARTGL